MEQESSITYGIESHYAIIENKNFGLIKKISEKLSTVRELESQVAIVIEITR